MSEARKPHSSLWRSAFDHQGHLCNGSCPDIGSEDSRDPECFYCNVLNLEEQYEGALATIETLESKEELSAIIRSQTEEIESLEEQLEALVETLEQIAGPTPTSHRKTVDQLNDAVKWRQGIARDALARLDSNPASRQEDA